MRFHTSYFILLMITLFGSNSGWGQKITERTTIDAERMSLDFRDREAITQGRDFVRRDSTYYIGWMYQGLFLDDRSADKGGYAQALPYLRNAFLLLEKDFTEELKSVYNNTEIYFQYRRLYADYMEITRALRGCYEYLDMPDSAMWVINHIEEKDFKRDQFGLYGTKAWIIHRNRFFTDGRYSFLTNDVNENASLALKACYDGYGNILKNEYKISEWFGPYASEMDRHYLYHYLAMIHGYMQQYDSSEYYYNLMAEVGTISWNNYGSLKHELGEFAMANQLYGMEKNYDAGDKRLREPYYYLPMLKLYAGETQASIDIAREALTRWQSMPGFGWYNIAHARAFLYDGQLDSADIALTKAKNFKEVHISTTLTQTQYDFTNSLLRLLWYDKKIALLKLSNKGWWYQPASIYQWMLLKIKRYTHNYLLAKQLEENPERDRLIYDLFCGESTVSFDEILVAMQSLSPKYFAKLMEDKSDTDSRYSIKKYFELARGYMLFGAGKNKMAEDVINNILQTTMYDQINEILFIARVYQLKAAISEGQEKQQALNKMMQYFPTIVPFTGEKIKMALQVSGENEEVVTKLFNTLKKADIDWVDVAADGVPSVSIYVEEKDGKIELTIDSRNVDNTKIADNRKLIFKDSDDIALELLLRIFGKGGTSEPDFSFLRQ
jgi:hypothetical protein